jgi:hypothetical protein
MNKVKQTISGKIAVVLLVAAVVATASPFRFGQVQQPVKIQVDGEGHLRLSREGRAVYAKSASLTVANGKIATVDGDALLPTIVAPANTQKLEVDLEGNVYAIRAASKTKLGRIVLAVFPAEAVLNEKDGVLYASDRPKLANPGEDTNGVIRVEAAPAPKTKVETKSAAPIEIKLNDPKPETKKPDTLPAVDAGTSKPVLSGPIGSSGSKLDPKPVPTSQAPTTKAKVGPAKIVAVASAEVEGPNILLGEVATIEADEAVAATLKLVDLGESPILGAKRTVDRARILARLKAAGFETDKIELIVPAMIEVKRKGQNITQAQFNYAALKAVYESTGIQTEYVPDEESGPDFLAPAGPFALVAETISGLNAEVATIKVAVYVGTKRVNSRTVKLKAKTPIVAVKSGAPVKVFFRAGAAMVETQGIAKSSGKAGDTISVEVKVAGATEKTIHSGVLLPSGAVEVKL